MLAYHPWTSADQCAERRWEKERYDEGVQGDLKQVQTQNSPFPTTPWISVSSPVRTPELQVYGADQRTCLQNAYHGAWPTKKALRKSQLVDTLEYLPPILEVVKNSLLWGFLAVPGPRSGEWWGAGLQSSHTHTSLNSTSLNRGRDLGWHWEHESPPHAAGTT